MAVSTPSLLAFGFISCVALCLVCSSEIEVNVFTLLVHLILVRLCKTPRVSFVPGCNVRGRRRSDKGLSVIKQAAIIHLYYDAVKDILME